MKVKEPASSATIVGITRFEISRTPLVVAIIMLKLINKVAKIPMVTNVFFVML